MSQIAEQSIQHENNEEQLDNEESETFGKYLDDNLARVFGLLVPILSISIQNENSIRQIIGILNSNSSMAHNPDSLDLKESVQEAENLANRSTRPAESPVNQSTCHPVPTTSTPSTSKKRKASDAKVEQSPYLHCMDCNQIFKRGDGTYSRHLKESSCKPFNCTECGKLFKKRSYMMQHKASHFQGLHTGEPSAKSRRTNQNKSDNSAGLNVDMKQCIVDNFDGAKNGAVRRIKMEKIDSEQNQEANNDENEEPNYA